MGPFQTGVMLRFSTNTNRVLSISSATAHSPIEQYHPPPRRRHGSSSRSVKRTIPAQNDLSSAFAQPDKGVISHDSPDNNDTITSENVANITSTKATDLSDSGVTPLGARAGDSVVLPHEAVGGDNQASTRNHYYEIISGVGTGHGVKLSRSNPVGMREVESGDNNRLTSMDSAGLNDPASVLNSVPVGATERSPWRSLINPYVQALHVVSWRNEKASHTVRIEYKCVSPKALPPFGNSC